MDTRRRLFSRSYQGLQIMRQKVKNEVSLVKKNWKLKMVLAHVLSEEEGK